MYGPSVSLPGRMMVQGSPDCTDRRDVNRRPQWGAEVLQTPSNCLDRSVKQKAKPHEGSASTSTTEQLTCCSIFSPSAFHLSTPM